MKESKSLVHAIKSAQCLHTQNWPSSSMQEMSKCKSCLLERYAYPQSHFTSILWNIEIAKRWTKTISQFSIMHGRGMLWLHSSICFLAPQDSPLANGSMCFRSIFDITLGKVEVNRSFFWVTHRMICHHSAQKTHIFVILKRDTQHPSLVDAMSCTFYIRPKALD